MGKKRKKRKHRGEKVDTCGIACARVDGACLGNPGLMGIGGQLTAPDGTVVATFSEAAGCGTNNEAEYLAVIRALELARENNLAPFLVISDSQLVVRQLNGEYGINYLHLTRPYERIRSLSRQIPGGVRFIWVPRERNHVADALASKAAGMPQAVIKPWTPDGFVPDPELIKGLPEPKPACTAGINKVSKLGQSAKFQD